MSKLRNLIRIFDIYGNYFQLRINNQTKFKTCSGGLLSIITFALLLFCLLSFGNDFFNRKNPKISIEEGLFQDSEIPLLNGTEYPIKPMMMTIHKSVSNVAKPRIGVKINNTFILKYLDECKPAYMDTYFPEYNYTRLSASVSSYCWDLNDFNPTNDGYTSLSVVECSTIDKDTLASFSSNGVSCKANITAPIAIANIVLYTKQLGFNPQLEKPFINKTIKYNFGFINTYVTTVNMFWNLQYLVDDIGWLIDSTNDVTDLAPQQEVMQVQPIPARNVPAFIMTFYLNDKFRRYNRTYAKLQDLLASLGGFMKLILTLLNLISMIIRNFLIDLYIINEKFEGENMNKGKRGSTDNITLGKGNANLENSQHSNYHVNVLELQNNYVDVKITKSISICTYSQAVLLNWCGCKESKLKGSPTNLLRKKLKVVNAFQDYSYVLRKLNEFEILKKVMLNDKQVLCFDYLAKPYSSDADPLLSQNFSTLFNSKQINKENLTNYYAKVLTEEPLGGYDEKMYKYLNDDIKEEILKRINK
jgi:hypothetical protein